MGFLPGAKGKRGKQREDPGPRPTGTGLAAKG